MEKFSILDAVYRQVDPAGAAVSHRGEAELEASRAYKKAHPERAFRGSIIVPDEALGLDKRDVTVGGSGANLVEQTLLAQDFIGYLYTATPIMGLGPTVLRGLVGNASIPRGTGTTTPAWVGEGVAPTESDPTFDKIDLTPKSLRVTTTISRRALIQATPGLEQIVRNDLARALGVALETAIISGDGTANDPVGILSTSGIGSVALGTNGAAPTWAGIVGLPKALAEANALRGNLAFLGNQQVSATLQITAKISGYPRFLQEDPQQVAGYKFAQSQAVPSNLTKGTGTNLSALIFGNWQDLVVGFWPGLQIIVDPFAYSSKGSVRITAFLDVDVALRHPASFAAITDMVTS